MAKEDIMIDFRGHLRKKILDPKDRILEFGPLTKPIVTKRTHPNVRFADVKSTADIKKLYTSNDYLKSTGLSVDLNSIIDIDYVVTGNYKESFKGVEKFDTIILAHVIEHMPDIIFFFQDVMNLLNDEGRLVLIYPDARYCFDHFRNGTSFIEAYDVYKDSKNSSRGVFDFTYNVVPENDPSFFWQNPKQNNILPKNDFHKSLTAYSMAQKNVLPDDTHFWPFADYQFIKFLYDMDRARLLELEIEKFFQTQEDTQEFMVILKPKSNNVINIDVYKKILNSVSPSAKAINSKVRLGKLNKRLAHLRSELVNRDTENEKLRTELVTIYGSKKWKYASRASKIKSIIVRKDGKK